MTIQKQQLLQELNNILNQSITTVEGFKQLSYQQLTAKPNLTSWNMLECIEHLNVYGNFYIPAINKQLNKAVPSNSQIFVPGLLGNYFVNLIQVNNKGIKKLKTPANNNPLNKTLTTTILDTFLQQLQQLKKILITAEKVNLTKTKTAISISKLIKLRLGDTLRFVVYHIERHLQQATHCHTQ